MLIAPLPWPAVESSVVGACLGGPVGPDTEHLNARGHVSLGTKLVPGSDDSSDRAMIRLLGELRERLGKEQ